jgi:hypothetical protein
MCSVSDQFKLCSCSGKEIEKLPAVWFLFSRKQESEVHTITMGELKCPQPIDEELTMQNLRNIVQRLSEPDVFDHTPQLNSGDLLVLQLRSGEKLYGPLEYCFEYSGGKWESSEYDYFDRLNYFKSRMKGKIQDPLSS